VQILFSSSSPTIPEDTEMRTYSGGFTVTVLSGLLLRNGMLWAWFFRTSCSLWAAKPMERVITAQSVFLPEHQVGALADMK
jgi:hypothetical protein